MYRLLRSLLFRFDPEKVHYFSMNALRLVCRVSFLKKLFFPGRVITRPGLERTVTGIRFSNPVGLAAGFDKNARWLAELEALGFGCVEIGTVTPRPQAGNEKPRLFRLPKDKALINRMGFNNEGLEAVAERLRKWRQREAGMRNREQGIRNDEQGTGNKEQGIRNDEQGTGKEESLTRNAGTAFNLQPSTFNFQPRLIIGGNIGKNKTTPNDLAWQDYETCFRALHPYVDYFVDNVSSPNTPGLRELQDKESLRQILTRLQQLNQEIGNLSSSSVHRESLTGNDEPSFNLQHSTFNIQHSPRPIFLKIAPDLTHEQLDDVIALALEINLDGIVATNTTISREGLRTPLNVIERIGAGGLSGLPVQQRSTDVVKYIHKQSGGRLPVIASGGIFTAEDARAKLEAGASLVQVWTGFIYEGPGIVTALCRGL